MMSDPTQAPAGNQEMVTVPEDGTYTRRDGTTVELEAGTQITHDEAVEFGLIETDEGGGGEETAKPEEQEADS